MAQIIFEDDKENNEYVYGKFGDFKVIIMKKNGYINASKLCEQDNKQLRSWIRNDSSQKLIETVKNMVYEKTGEKTEVIIKINNITNNLRGSYVHSDLIPHIASWVSPDFAVKVSTIMNDTKIQNEQLKEENEKLRKITSDLTQNVKPLDGRTIMRELKMENGCVINIEQRSDGYINATKLCKAGNKLFGDYNRLKTTNEFINDLSLDMGIPISKIIEHEQHKSVQNTYVHPLIAINLSQWISPKFNVQVSKWTFELLTTSSVTLGKEKAISEIMQIEIDNIQKKLNESVELLKKQSNLISKLKDTEQKQINKIKEQMNQIKELEDKLMVDGDIYVIKCNLCNKRYVGSSNDAKIRFETHKHDRHGSDSLSEHIFNCGTKHIKLDLTNQEYDRHGSNPLSEQIFSHGSKNIELECVTTHRYNGDRHVLRTFEQEKIDEIKQKYGNNMIINKNNAINRTRSKSRTKVGT